MEVWAAPGRTKPTFIEASNARYSPTTKGHRFGPSWTNHWVKITLNVPQAWEECERVQLEFDSSSEAMVYSSEGEPLQGLTGGTEVDRRVEFIIPEHERKKTVQYFIEVSANKRGGQAGSRLPVLEDNFYELKTADLVAVDMVAWNLMWDFRVIQQLSTELPADSSLAMRAQWTAHEIMNAFRKGDRSSLDVCRKAAKAILGENWQDIEPPKHAGTLWGLGHW